MRPALQQILAHTYRVDIYAEGKYFIFRQNNVAVDRK